MWKETDLEYMKNKYKINRGVCDIPDKISIG